MTLETIRRECTDVAGLLQPLIDDELGESERTMVLHHVQHCEGCRAAIEEQRWVRSALQALTPATAPSRLHARVRAALDAVDNEQLPTASRRRHVRLGALLRGALVMAPVGAAAGALVVWQTADTETFSALSAHLPAPHESAHSRDGFVLQLPQPDSGVELVSAEIDEDPQGPTAHVQYRMVRGDDTFVVVHQQRPGPSYAGQTGSIHGPLEVNWTEQGVPVVHFEHGGITHELRDTTQRRPGQVQHLLELARQLTATPGPQQNRPPTRTPTPSR